jgi:hypothetical protein
VSGMIGLQEATSIGCSYIEPYTVWVWDSWYMLFSPQTEFELKPVIEKLPVSQKFCQAEFFSTPLMCSLNECDCVKFETLESSSPLGYHAVSTGKWLLMFQWDSLFPCCRASLVETVSDMKQLVLIW